MKLKNTIFILALLACFVTLFGFTFVEAKASEKDEVLRVCGQLFGKSVDEKLNLFEVNRFYVLRASFSKNNDLDELAIEPKYYYEETHLAWEEPVDFSYLSEAKYKNLLIQLDTIKPKGAFIKSPSLVSVITNQTAELRMIYENAILTDGVLMDVNQEENAPVERKWFRLKFEKQKSRQ